MDIREFFTFRKRFILGIYKPSKFTTTPTWVSQTSVTELTSNYRAHVLGKQFKAFGSDKSTVHDYHVPYGWLLEKLSSDSVILEIGIGTNNPDLPSTMGKNGVPGASLRAWKSTKKFQSVIGADIDPNCMFSEQNIETYIVDQLNSSSLKKLGEVVQASHPQIHLIVDDGLHTFEANTKTFEELFEVLSVGGYYVIEDITPQDLPLMLEYLYKRINVNEMSLWMNPDKGLDNSLIIIAKPNDQ